MSFSNRFFAFALASFLGFTGSAWAQNPGPVDMKDSMTAAAARAGVDIHTDNIITSAGGGATVASTTLVGFEQVPATALPGGVNAGFIYLDAPRSGIPAGFYTLRASAPQSAVRVGQFGGNVDLVDARGRVVAALPASFEVSSLTVPDPLPFARTTIRQSFQTVEQNSIIIIVITCPNGTTIIIVIFD